MARGSRFRSRNPVKLAASGWYIADTQVTTTAAKLNACVTAPVAGVATGYKIAYGYQASIDGSLEIATGLATVSTVLVTLCDEANVGSSSGYFAVAYKKGVLGSIEIAILIEGGTAYDASVEVNWIAIGT